LLAFFQCVKEVTLPTACFKNQYLAANSTITNSTSIQTPFTVYTDKLHNKTANKEWCH